MRRRGTITTLALLSLLGAAACGENEGGAIGDEQTDVGEGTTGIGTAGDGIQPAPPVVGDSINQPGAGPPYGTADTTTAP
ncbi:MAG TPA: hypothetical protein VHG51_14905 [Longimicrobiaceae bacterium]|nr:hypothetical protein [Longimicrobiaceae bacterium]